MNAGKRYEQKLKESFRQAGYFHYRIVDNVYRVHNKVQSIQTLADMIVMGTKIGGYGSSLHGYLIEAKAESTKSLSFSRLSEHQYQALKDFDSIHENMHGMVAINFYDQINIRRKDRCFFVPINVWDLYKDGDRASISEEQCQDDSYIIECEKVGTCYKII